MKTDQQKALLIEQFRKTPIVQIACEKTGIGRATYYRWRSEDITFAKQSDEALTEGSLLINDMAESQLISAIKDKNIPAITFWLKHHHTKYASKLEVDGKLRIDEQLSPEQAALVQQALQRASLTIDEE